MPHDELIRRHSQPLEPIPTGVQLRLQALDGIRAVLFDIYGTLLISASGDISNADEHNEQACRDALLEADLAPIPDGAAKLHQAILHEHDRLRIQHQVYPEMDIRHMWRAVLQQQPDTTDEQIETLAVAYELRVNPVWPMPDLVEALAAISERYSMGLISNAQFLTPLLFQPLTGKSLDELGFDRQLRFYSFEHRTAKPGLRLYELARAQLRVTGIEPSAVLYVGNDVKKDIHPATTVGFRTALFAGDQRSLRLHKNDETLAGLVPDLVISDLSQLVSCIS